MGTEKPLRKIIKYREERKKVGSEGRKEGRMIEVFVSSVYRGNHHGSNKLLFTAVSLVPHTHTHTHTHLQRSAHNLNLGIIYTTLLKW
jgi:hypothetical protein